MKWRPKSLVLALLFFSTPTLAQDDDPDLLADLAPPAFAAGGTVKLLGIGYDIPDTPPLAERAKESSVFGSLRLKLEGTPRDWLSFEVHLRVEADAYSASSLARFDNVTETETTLFRGLGHEVTFDENDTYRLWGEVDYANVRLTRGQTDVVLGRQAVTFGRSFFWNPTDWLSSFAPTEIDREYKGGVDALRISHGLGRFSGVELVYAYGEDGDADRSALLGRAYANWRDWDVEVLGGRVLTDDRLGFGWSGEVRGAGVRGELAIHRPRVDGERDFVRATLEADYRWPSSWLVSLELHYNGFGSSDPADYEELFASPRVATGQIQNVGRRYFGGQASYELTPLLTLTGAVLVNLDDGSGVFNPSFVRSLSDESDLVVGALVPWGESPSAAGLRSEYGSYFSALWVQWRWSF